jgi:hypothetical protein
MQRRPRQVRDRRLQRIQAIIKGHQSMPAESNNDGFLLNCQDCRTRMLRPRGQVGYGAPLPPFGNRLLVDAMQASQHPQALLTMLLYRSTDCLCGSGAPM